MSITPTLHRTFHIINCSVYFLLPAHAAALFSTRPLQDFFATMSSDKLKKDKQHQRKISFTALAFFYYIIVIKAPT